MTDDLGQWSGTEQEELKKMFLAGARELIEDLQEELLKIESGIAGEDSLRTVKRYVHTLKGDSSSVGFTSVANLCHRMEDVLSFVAGDGADRLHDSIGLLLSCVDALRSLLDGGGHGEDNPPAEALMRRIDGFLGKRAGALPAGEGSVLTEYQQLQAKAAAQEGLGVYAVDAVFHPECGERSVAARMALRRMNGIGRIIHTVPAVESDGIESADRFTAVFATDRSVEEIGRAVLLAGLISDARVREYPGAESKTAALSDSFGGPHSAVRAATLRIESSRLDRLMNLVGELIIGRSMVNQVAMEAGGLGADETAARLKSVNAYLERTLSDLQKSVMRLRMVPVNQALRKFPRMVRDLALSGGKSVRIDLFGKETELDKGIVDALGEPLTHIIRNMIDHGIEEPEQRRAAGKPGEGVITVRVYHEAAQVVIELSDDGRGLDTAKLKHRAVEGGFLSPEEAAGMQDNDAMNLIYLPGLSTAESVTETSGRGVGMDAVKSAVERIRGSVETASTPGKGMLLRLRLPLTLAVIKALLFEAGGRQFALPLSSVLEIAKLRPGELRTVDGTDAVLLRDRLVSLIRLDRLFNIPEAAAGGHLALILNLANRRVGLLVDRIAGQQDLVIKSLEGMASRSEMIAGASILGDGKVVIILDAPAVVRKAIKVEKKEKTAA